LNAAAMKHPCSRVSAACGHRTAGTFASLILAKARITGAEKAQEGSVTRSRRAAPPEKNGMPDGPISRGFGSWSGLRVGSASKVRLSVHQRADAAPLHKSRRTSSTKLPYDGVPDDRSNNCANTSPDAAARNLGVFATARAPCLPLSAADAMRIWRAPFRRTFRATNDSLSLRRHQQAGWRQGPPQGVRKCGRRGDMVRGNDPEGVAFEYEVLE
jgi:hypothetical protein